MRKRNGRTNGELASEDPAHACLVRIEDWLDEIEEHKSVYMNAAKALRAEISGLYARAKDDGVNTRAVKALVKTRQLDRTKQKVIEALDLDNLSSYRTYAEWGDTPLAQAAAPQ